LSSSCEEDEFFRGMLVAIFYVEWMQRTRNKDIGDSYCYRKKRIIATAKITGIVWGAATLSIVKKE